MPDGSRFVGAPGKRYQYVARSTYRSRAKWQTLLLLSLLVQIGRLLSYRATTATKENSSSQHFVRLLRRYNSYIVCPLKTCCACSSRTIHMLEGNPGSDDFRQTWQRLPVRPEYLTKLDPKRKPPWRRSPIEVPSYFF